MSINKVHISIAVLFIFYVVGLVGITSDHSDFFLSLTPLNLLLTLAILLVNHSDWNRVWWIFPLTAFAGLVVEIIGVNTGFPFGQYEYGWVLGPKILNTSVVIGVNWLILLYATNSMTKPLSIKSPFIRAAISALMMVFLDFLIEPIAITLDFWSWSEPAIPMTNYLAWFVISFILSAFWQKSTPALNSVIGIAVFLSQLGFFGILNLVF